MIPAESKFGVWQLGVISQELLRTATLDTATLQTWIPRQSTRSIPYRAMDPNLASLLNHLAVGTLSGVRQLVAFTAEALTGLDLKTGETLWRVPFRTGAKRHRRNAAASLTTSRPRLVPLRTSTHPRKQHENRK